MFGLYKKIGEAKRLEQIASCLFRHELGFLIYAMKLKIHLPLAKTIKVKKSAIAEHTQAKVFREIAEELGGAFLKLGQMLSLRPDLVGKEISKEFEKLLDNVPPEKSEDIQKMVELHMPQGMPAFKHFNHEPIAAGSVAQVHKAILKDGTVVAVKVERPLVKEKFEQDIALMNMLAQRLKDSINISFADPVEIVEEFRKYTIKELDFSHEAKNMERFRLLFKSQDKIIIPRIYKEYCSSQILVMEFIEGIPMSKAPELSKQQRENIIHNVTESVFHQIFEEGFFHADIHPGNLLLVGKDKLALLDFGIMGYIDRELKEKLTELFVALVEADLDKVADVLID